MNSSRKIAIAGIIGAISFLLTFIEFPIFPVVGFLKFDPSDSLIIFTNLVYGFVPSLLTLIVKSFLFIFKSGDGGLIGILMNFISGFVFIGILNLFKDKINRWILYFIDSLIVGFVLFFMNYFISIPVYTNMKTSEFINTLPINMFQFFVLTVIFNLIKFFIDSIIAHLLNKRIKVS
ncbi:ECF transporter S component [Oceanotoga sp. DSM 15011]|jgi:riboflavin transporter FmnP|uniref:Riboflavin transporter n=1 Tax=Oceanotoga teriensis TaxID=515440 RepID=A0AA45C628_9BACT|nr:MULTISPECIES: ECF transporter S component [Oceanotoga]MDN5341747.1 riboflavin transporter [Oceanotoga sp.]MDO7975659.1 ECF transporter S component [Oceanotoga teriensis]PWJ90592.1 riboflavin transporter FmnP [Oceanotoga teriensis]UYO99837.1 ECF transporter S component [Oceanotoga sp. DSM 15011]